MQSCLDGKEVSAHKNRELRSIYHLRLDHFSFCVLIADSLAKQSNLHLLPELQPLLDLHEERPVLISSINKNDEDFFALVASGFSKIYYYDTSIVRFTEGYCSDQFQVLNDLELPDAPEPTNLKWAIQLLAIVRLLMIDLCFRHMLNHYRCPSARKKETTQRCSGA